MGGGQPGTGGPGIGQGVPRGPSGGDCHTCEQPIYGPIVAVKDRKFHPNCFVCESCSQPFNGAKYIIGPDKNFYCEGDFMDLYAKKCQVCNSVIKSKIIEVMNGDDNLSYHSEHFVCVCCGLNLVGRRYKIEEGTLLLHCLKCIEKEIHDLQKEAHMCAMCNLPIQGPYLLIEGKYLHPRHYRCTDCGIEFKGGDCNEFEGDLYCKVHYEILLLKKCAKCGKPIKGLALTAIEKSWHPDHFTCHICNELLAEKFFAHEGLPYCAPHYAQLFGESCAHCHDPIIGTGQVFLDKAYHTHHFFCNTCKRLLKSGEFTSWDEKPICKKCYNELPHDLRARVEKRLKAEKRAKVAREKEEMKELKKEQKAGK